MRNQIVSEFRKLTTTRSGYWLLGALIVLSGLAAAGVLAGDLVTAHTSELDGPLQTSPLLFFPLSTAMVFTLILGIRSFTDEFHHGSIVPTLLASPDRRRVLAAKVVTVGVASTLFAVAAIAGALAVGVPGMMAKGIDVTWSSVAMAEILGRLIVACVLWGTIGVGIGLAVRHQVAAIVGALVWALVAESLIGSLLPGVSKFLPGPAGSAIVGIDATTLLAPGIAMVVLAAWAAAVALTGERLMDRRDVV